VRIRFGCELVSGIYGINRVLWHYEFCTQIIRLSGLKQGLCLPFVRLYCIVLYNTVSINLASIQIA